MQIPAASNLFARIAGKFPLRTVLIVPFVLQIVGTVGLVGYLSYRNGQQAVEDLAYQLINQVNEGVEQNLQHYLDVPKHINQSFAAAIRTRVLDWKNFAGLESYFAQQLQIYPTVSGMAIATEQKEFLTVERSLASDSLAIRVMDKSTDYAFHRYTADRQGKRIKLTKVRHDYDPHNDPPDGRPWYRAAQEAGKAIWLPVVNLSQGVDRPILTIVNFLPFNDAGGKFQGVLAAPLYLPEFASFLDCLKVGRTGQVFVIDRQGLLIASSTGETPFKQNLNSNYLKNLNTREWRQVARNSTNPLTQASVNFLLTQVKNFNQIEHKKKFDFDFHRSRHFLQVNPISDKYELDWLIVTVVPEADFMTQIHANTRTAILLCIAALIGSTGIGILTARWITKPILGLNTAAKDIAKGEWDKPVEINRADEVGELANSFNKMAAQLQQSFTELQSLNAALVQSESRLNQILEAMSVGVSVHDITGQLIYANQTSRQLLGIETLPEAETEQLAISYQVYQAGTEQLYPAENLPVVRSFQGERVRVEDMEIRRPDRTVPLEVYSTPLFDENGNIVAAIATFADITDRKQTEKILAGYNRTLEVQVAERTAELASANAHLEQEICDRKQAEIALAAAALAAEAASLAKSSFLANMSHELRTPLNGIMGYAQILLRDPNRTSKQHKSAGVIYQCSEHLLMLINDILSLSKIEANKLELYPETFNFPAFMQGLSEIFRLKAQQKSIDFAYLNLNQIPNQIYADEKRLRQILMNLLSNAVKFTDRGSVTFTVEVIENEAAAIGNREENAETRRHADTVNRENLSTFPQLGDRELPTSKIRFLIEDTGVGIPTEHLKKIFLPFEQVGNISDRTEGTGLGLAITHRLISLMESEIFVESNPGVGSRFWFDLNLPFASDTVDSTPVRSSDRIVGYQGKRQKILVVDDRWENRSVIVNLLEAIGFEFAEAADGQEGLEKAVEFQPDLIFADLVMPRMDGLALIRQLRQLPLFQSTIIIAVSASVFDADRQNCLESGCNDFLAKPIQAKDLLNKIKSYLNLSWICQQEASGENFTAAFPLASSPEEMSVPPREELLILHEAAQSGNVEGVEQEVIRLKQLNPQYSFFAARVQELSEDFEYEAIFNLLDRSE
ncbi:response regulator [Microcoleus sp. ARI1-B5]|uniref:response regulator n=1 Tax=unclassified Microcoleus TaxID=2642155 RepID=UPI002FCFD00E